MLVNLATVHYLLKNVPEAMKYYHHALEVLCNIESQANASSDPRIAYPLLAEFGKVNMSLGNLHKDLHEPQLAQEYFNQAIIKFQDFIDKLDDVETKVNAKRKVDVTLARYN